MKPLIPPAYSHLDKPQKHTVGQRHSEGSGRSSSSDADAGLAVTKWHDQSQVWEALSPALTGGRLGPRGVYSMLPLGECNVQGITGCADLGHWLSPSVHHLPVCAPGL